MQTVPQAAAQRPPGSAASARPHARSGPGLPGGACIQAKLQVSQPGDALELEADRIAEQVMRMPDPGLPVPLPPSRALQPLAMQRLCAACEEEEKLQRKAQYPDARDGTASAVDHVGAVLRQGGRPLDAAARAFFEPRFGVDLGGVRVHTGGQAAQSARDMGARAYTVGSDVVFNAGQYSPHSRQGRQLLAHELAHVLQQRDRVQRQADPDTPGPCDQHHVDDLIDPAFAEAARWRRLAAAWLEAHLDHIRARGSLARDGFVRVGRRVFDELMLLEQHFRISSVLRVALPYSADDLVSVEDLQRLGNASYWVRRRFGEVELTLAYQCQMRSPPARVGTEVLGSAVAGSRALTLYTRSFDPQSAITRAAVVLHEAFHASFGEFDHDSYSFQSHYPGANALTNADSYATFASVIATGGSYRIIVLPEITIHGGE